MAHVSIVVRSQFDERLQSLSGPVTDIFGLSGERAAMELLRDKLNAVALEIFKHRAPDALSGGPLQVTLDISA